MPHGAPAGHAASRTGEIYFFPAVRRGGEALSRSNFGVRDEGSAAVFINRYIHTFMTPQITRLSSKTDMKVGKK